MKRLDGKTKAMMMLITAMAVFGTIGIFRRYIPLPSSILAVSRGFIGMLFLVLVMLIKRQPFAIRSIKNNLLLLCVSGGLIGFNWILLFEAYNYTTVATATLCYYMAPIFVILVSPLLFKEKMTAKKMICVLTALVGMVFVSGVFEPASAAEGVGADNDLFGILLGLSAAVLYASVVVLNKKIKNVPAFDKTAFQLGAAAVIMLIYTLFTEDLTAVSFTPFSVIMLIIVGVVHTGIAYTLYFGSIDRLPAQTVALFSYIDPCLAIILSATVLREGFSILGIIGAVMVLGATMISEVSFGKKKA